LYFNQLKLKLMFKNLLKPSCRALLFSASRSKIVNFSQKYMQHQRYKWNLGMSTLIKLLQHFNLMTRQQTIKISHHFLGHLPTILPLLPMWLKIMKIYTQIRRFELR